MLVIGLTGGIGTGKSEVARILGELGAVVIGADQVGHEAYQPDTDVWREIIAHFGKEIISLDGQIDRSKLGAMVFSKPDNLLRLNQIMHPRMARIMADRIEQLRGQGASVVVLEAALLFEAEWDRLVDEIWVTTSPLESVRQRLTSRNSLSEVEVDRRVRSQLPAAERLKKADLVIENSGDLAQLEATIKALWQSRVAKYESR